MKNIPLHLVLSFVLVVMTLSAAPTPRQAEGPYYPLTKIDPQKKNTDWNLAEIDGGEAADGEFLELTGKVVTTDGKPLAGHKVEIWQTDDQGHYNHRIAPNNDEFDARFQGFGAVMTQQDGSYRFMTIIPARYPGRTPHIHLKVWRGDRELLITQVYFKDNANSDDWIFSGSSKNKSLEVALVPASLVLPESKKTVKGFKSNFDVVLK